jgi:hypothetical protein
MIFQANQPHPSELKWKPATECSTFEEWEAACKANGLLIQHVTTVADYRVYEAWRITSKKTGRHLGATLFFVMEDNEI